MFWSILVVLLVILLVLPLLILFLFQKWLLYLPQIGFNKSIFPWNKQVPEDAEGEKFYSHLLDPKTYHELDYEEIYIPTLDGKLLHSWFIKALEGSEEAPTIVFYHGNAGSIALRLPFLASIVKKLHCNVFTVEYRGYGKSQGTPNESDFINDVYCAVELLFSTSSIYSSHPYKLKYKSLMEKHNIELDHSKVLLFGRSLGGAVTIGALSTFKEISSKISAFIVENTFLSIEDMVLEIINKNFSEGKTKKTLHYFIGLLLRLSWKSKLRVGKIELPALFLSSRKDRLVPPTHMDRLWNLFKRGYVSPRNTEKSSIRKFPYGGHNNTWQQKGYFTALKDFLHEVVEQY